MAFHNKLGLALQGFGAGVQGRGQQFTQNINETRKQALLEDAFTVQQQLQSGDTAGARLTLIDRLDAIKRFGGNDSDTLGLLNKIEGNDLQGAFNDVSTVVDFGVRSGRLNVPATAAQQTPSGIREFEFLSQNLAPDEVEKARRISLGLSPRAVGSSVQTINAQDIAADISATQATIEEGKETGKLSAQLKLQPKIQKAVSIAVSAATSLADNAKLDKTNESTFNVYETGMRGLVTGLDNSLTGPFIGMIPAVTANQQIADGAIAAMAPVMKQMFRAAGEGIFTDKDQELLLEMIPSRQDFPAARKAKLINIDAIVKAKLGIVAPQQNTGVQQSTAPQLPQGFEQMSPADQQELLQLIGQNSGN